MKPNQIQKGVKEQEYKDIITDQAFMICQMCVRLNPQHKGCSSCTDMENIIPIVEDVMGQSFVEAKEDFDL